MPHFLNLSDAGLGALTAILTDAAARKAARAHLPKGAVDADAPLAGHTLACIFEKNSTRTRVSFDMAMRQLGGSTLVLDAGSTQLGRGESIADTARVLSRYVDAIMIRTDAHSKLEDMAAHASVPIINGLSDLSHPCQVMADLITVIEGGTALKGGQWAYFGDGNNMTNSLIEAAGLFQFSLNLACPQGYDADAGFIAAAQAAGARVKTVRDANAAARQADVLVTDTWVSMGQAQADEKLAAMQPYQVNETLLALAKPQAQFLHCLPAHRGEEASDAVLDGAQSRIWDEAENRLHVQKSILLWALGKL